MDAENQHPEYFKDWLEEENPGRALLAVEIVDSVGYAALRDNKTKEVHAQIVLLDLSKDFHEAEGPFARECPASILNLLTPTNNKTANEWRKSCREALEWKTAFDSLWTQLLPGDSVEYICDLRDKHTHTVKDATSWEFEETKVSIAPKCDFLSAFTKGKLKAFRNGKEISLNSKN